jgi:leader peptidase (prepilin peptidase)/N-methyltransferase
VNATSAQPAVAAGAERAPLVCYPLVVVPLAVSLGALAFTRYPVGGRAAIAAFLAAVLVLLAVTDLERMVIPNRVVLPATVIVLLAHAVFTPGRVAVYVLAAAGATVAFLIPHVINRSLMGMGDVKLAALVGAGVGFGVVGATAVAFLAVFPVALGMLIRGGAAARKAAIPFGPFLALGGLVILVFHASLGFAS